MATMTLDNLISESGRRSGIGAAAEPLTRDLLRLMTGGPGGLGAFLERFRSAGLGAEVAAFIGGRSEAELPPQAVDTVIGETTVASMAKRVGVAPAAATTALGFEIPKLIALLTPGGRVPTALPSDVQSFVGREHVAPAATVVHDEAYVRPAAAVAAREGARDLRWLWALLALLVLAVVIGALFARSRPAATVTAPAVPTPAVSLPAAPAAPPAAVTTTVADLNRDLNRAVLNFATASAVLPEASAPQLQQAADEIKKLPAGSVIEIGGHTDNTGKAAANMALSQNRADAVRNVLIQDGVAPAMLTARGYGDTKPIASNDTPDGRLQNRRTEFTVVNTTASTTTTTTPAAQ
jgi:outer membrane protein OmpA-like peptidoglycan-associated protein/uncharacterized protein YidB (DUF937 family)